MQIRSRSRGFTLVEIMVVVVIIGVLAALALPALQRSRQASVSGTVKNNLRQLYAAAQQYFTETGGGSAVFGDLVGPGKWMTGVNSAGGEDYVNMPAILITSASISVAVPSLGGNVVTYAP